MRRIAALVSSIAAMTCLAAGIQAGQDDEARREEHRHQHPDDPQRPPRPTADAVPGHSHALSHEVDQRHRSRLDGLLM